MAVNAANVAANLPANLPAPPVATTVAESAAFEAHTDGSEQEHIERALEASQTAMEAIQTLLGISTWVLGILAVVLAIIGIFGWGVISRGTKATAERLANKRISEYIHSSGFVALVEARAEEVLEAKWQNWVAGKALNMEGGDDAGGVDQPFDQPE